MSLQNDIENAYNLTDLSGETRALFQTFKDELNSGAIRAAEKHHDVWKVNKWVKKGILLGFRLGVLSDYSLNDEFRFFDKDTFPLKKLTLQDKVRQIPGGSAVRDGAHIAPGVVIVPPAYINVGAYVDSGSMIDSHALVGSCAQIGKNVHLSAAAQIGGVLEPVGGMPVIIEDNVLVGGNSGVYDGAIVSEEVVIGAGTIITGSTPIFDLVHDEILRKTEIAPLVIPKGAVVVQGSRSVDSVFARKYGISVNTPVIIKFRDDKTSAATALEAALR